MTAKTDYYSIDSDTSDNRTNNFEFRNEIFLTGDKKNTQTIITESSTMYSSNDTTDSEESDYEDTKSECNSDYEVNANAQIVRQILDEFQKMKMQYRHQEESKGKKDNDIEMQYTLTKHIGDSQKYFGSSTDTNNDENIQRTFEVEVCIETQPRQYSTETEEMQKHSKNETISKAETNSIREETSADELTEDTSEDEEEDDVDHQNIQDVKTEESNENFEQKEIPEKNQIMANEVEIENQQLNGKEEDDKDDCESNSTNRSQNSLQKENIDSIESKSVKEKIESQESVKSKNKLTSESFTNLGNTISDEEEFEIENKDENNEESEKFSLIKKSLKSQNGSFSMEISSKRPSSFNSEEYPFELSFPNNRRSTPDFRTRINQNRNLSFSNERMREIERTNQVLLKKILTQKSAYETRSLVGNKQKQTLLYKNNRQTSAAINRKKQQRQIDMDNQVLKRKLEAIAYRNPLH